MGWVGKGGMGWDGIKAAEEWAGGAAAPATQLGAGGLGQFR